MTNFQKYVSMKQGLRFFDMKKTLPIIIILAGVFLGFTLVTKLLANILWFEEIGYLPFFLKRLSVEIVLWVITFLISSVFLLGNLNLAKGFKWHFIPENKQKKYQYYRAIKLREEYQDKIRSESPSIGFPWLLITVFSLYGLIGLLVVYYSQLTINIWQPDFNLPNVTPPVPSPIEILWLHGLTFALQDNILQIIAVVIILSILVFKTELALKVIAIIISGLFGLIWAGNWSEVLKLLNATSFEYVDPQFHKNISFYIFTLPILQWLYFWLAGLFLLALLSVFLTYLISANSLSEGKFPGFSRPQLRHLYGLWGGAMLLLVFRHILNRYELLYSSRGVVYGAGYTDVHLQQYIEIFLGIVAGIGAVWLFKKAITGSSRSQNTISFPHLKNKSFRDKFLSLWRSFPVYLWLIGIYLIILLVGFILSNTVQLIIVQPNELIRETPYIKRSIKYTREAFNLNKIEAKTFDPQAQLTANDLENNPETVENIRLWDTRPLLEANRQLQQIRLYYRFPDASIDRYLMKKEDENNPSQINTRKQQVIIAARELDYQEVPAQAQTWVNKHLIYTHGYGFTLSPVNLVGEAGLPYYFVKDIQTDFGSGGLTTSSELVRYTIPITKPRIYYGQLTNNYVMTSTKVKEFDFPSGEENVYNVYDGTGGIGIGSGWRRFLFAAYLKDWKMLFTRDFTPETRLLFRRNIEERLQTIAPFLQYDRDPYLVIADLGKNPGAGTKNTLYWIVDAYTISNRYPYSDPGDNQFNYIRNSVKVVIDAYNGDVVFYIADATDPIIQTWNKIFPKMFHSLEEMPPQLISHIRYPEDFFSTQSERLLTYHMIDPQVFYNREDQWQIPQEVYGAEANPIPIEPYYLIMKLPEETSGEFILLHPYTPISRPNLIAWLAARSDGKQYGKLLLYQFPKQRLVYGPNQIEALINQDPEISQQISLWNREGSRVQQGNLLVIPIEESLLYVEPIYLVAEQYGVPTLARVIVFYENQIVMAETLNDALNAIFKPEATDTDAIIRPVEIL